MPLDLNEILNQVNEEEEDNQVEQGDLALMQGIAEPVLDIAPAIEVNIPVVNEPENFLPLEIQEDELMADEEIKQLLDEEAAQGNAPRPQNIHVGYVFTGLQPNISTVSPFVPAFWSRFEYSSGMWKKFFVPNLG